MTDFASVKERHGVLSAEFFQMENEIVKNPTEFLGRLQELLKDMHDVSAKLTSVQDYAWLQKTVSQWRLLSSSSLNTPIETTLLPPEQPLRPPSEQEKLSTRDVEQRLASKANELFKRRLITRHHGRSEQEIIQQELAKLSYQQRTDEEIEDWYQANIYLAAEVLDGKIHLVPELSPDSYQHLEGRCWLSELRSLKAYLSWLESGGGWGEEEMRRDYLDGCEQIRQRLMDPDVKLSQTAAEPLLEYVKGNYLTRSQSGAWKLDDSKTHDLVAAKARRVWELTKYTYEKENWRRAEHYAKDFYENIVPAATGDVDKIGAILGTLHYRGAGTDPDLVNCFEMAIALYCLDAVVVRNVLERLQVAQTA